MSEEAPEAEAPEAEAAEETGTTWVSARPRELEALEQQAPPVPQTLEEAMRIVINDPRFQSWLATRPGPEHYPIMVEVQRQVCERYGFARPAPIRGNPFQS